MKKSKIIAALIIIAMLVALIMPLTNAFAASAYTITFDVASNATATHSITIDSGHLKIDGQFVDPKLASDTSANFNGYSVDGSGNTYTMTITNGEEVVLNFSTANKFELFANGNPVAVDSTTFSSNTSVAIQDAAPQQQPPQQGTRTVKFAGPWNVGNASVSADRSGDVELGANDQITLTNFDPDTMQAVLAGEGRFSTNLTVTNGKTSLSTVDPQVNLPGGLEFKVVAKNNQQNTQQPDANGGPDNIEFDVKFTDTHVLMWVNDKMFLDDREGLKDTFKGTVTGAGYNAIDKTNTIKVQNSFGDAPLIEITINGDTFKQGDANVTIGPNNEFIVTVPGATKYTITGKIDPDFPIPRTIIWVNPDYVPKDAADAAWVKDFTISHGYAKVIEVYDETGKKLDSSVYISNQVQPDGSKSDNYGLNKGFGWIQVFKGYKVVFELEPEYGYQLTGIAINETPLKAIDNIVNRFEVIIPEGNLHFAATYTKTEDIVKAKSKKVASGSVELGGGLASGSAQLTVDDVEVSEDKKQEFTNAANGYTISDFLNISLYNVFYKGKLDSDDVWSNEIEELDEYVTVSIQLEEGVNADDIVIVHNIHDGKDYEVIEIESYDPETRILTFKTKSFSNYAIATKTSEKKEEKSESNPKTGDNIMMWTSIFAAACAGVVVTTKMSKVKKMNKHFK